MRRGVVTGSQCVAVAALRGGSRMLALLGDDAEAEILAEEGEALAERIRTQLWNPETMCFNDSLNPPDGVRRFSCDSNAVAVLLKIATPEQADGALAYLREHLWTPYGTRTILPPEPEENWNWAHNHNVWPFVVGLELEARFEHGDFEGAMELSRKCWGNMVDRGSEAFWEVVDLESGGFLTRRPIADIQPGWDAWDSYSHGWSAGISYMLQAFLLGIQPVEPGFAKFCVRPNFCGLEFIEGAVPTPHGTIEAHFEMRGTGRVLVPRGTRAEIMLPDGSSRKLEPGEHQVSWATQ
jgi:glycogen debranching enzyme